MGIVRRYRSLPQVPPIPVFDDGDTEWFPAVQFRIWRKHGRPSNKYLAIADTGSPYCLFDAAIGRSIGLAVEKGPPHPIAGVVPGASTTAYFHRVSLSIEDMWTLEIMAGFVERFNIGALLGRRGFFDNFSVRFDHSSKPPTFEIERIVRPS